MNAGELGRFLFDQPLLALTIGAILLAVMGLRIDSAAPRLGGIVRGTGYIGMVAALLLTVAGLAGHNRRSEAALWLDSAKPAGVEGNRTVIPMRVDGHFWVLATINGEQVDFLIDTGATYTGVSSAVARKAGLVPDDDNRGVVLETANGPIAARMATAASIKLGGIDARGLEVAIAPEQAGEVNVIGMNFLSRLAGWRVEGEKLILEPKAADREDGGRK
ncbi:retropepsin-like aspartic protease family protein [Novosphingobium colocasiae]|uniref:TIGR02281 family clan AA aspartic protease n=1 Tax=Novosphingobium colocasiae TaxID=1256513 RepID=A0A918PCW1_9SPHN|nr:TIGR02281 family clan AA aspartic protease [Novosphingobium colocasiae]GGY98639.1 hypothetical protein GCM10011614_12230 [Novosphingobium colocasiae]